MLFKITIFVLFFSIYFTSAPTNCLTCKGHFLIFHELKTNEEKIENMREFCTKYEGYHTFPFEYGLLDWIEKDGINNVVEKINKCTTKTCINELCSKLSNRTCPNI